MPAGVVSMTQESEGIDQAQSSPVPLLDARQAEQLLATPLQL